MASDKTSESPQQPQPAPPPDDPPKPGPARKPMRRWVRWLRAGGITLLMLLVVGAVGLSGAEYYTARPDFCASCHIMGPYYDSWSHDIHGRKLGVRCVDCHYAPGERFTVMAKFKGLSQVASYFSGRYGAGRPRAHVSDASCLRSSCHGDGDYLAKRLPIGEPRREVRLIAPGQEVEVTRNPTVHFYHEKHLDVGQRLAEVHGEIEQRTARLRSELPADLVDQAAALARSVAPAERRQRGLDTFLAAHGLSGRTADDLARLVELEHRRIRLKHLEGLNCAACHSFDESGANHLAVSTTTCFTCHFINEGFNRNTGECLRCHEAPTRAVWVHDQPAAHGSVLMDHQEIVRRGVDCASCHADVLRGEAVVTERDCIRCHDQDRYLKDFATRTTETVAEYHAVHVAGQRAHCEDCHHVIEHGLLAAKQPAVEAGFLEPVLGDCKHCHPNHHSEQVHLLTGTGGAGLPQATPSAMLGSRLNCRACHTQAAQDIKGDALLAATSQACIGCHSDDYGALFEQWRSEIATYLQEAESRLLQVEQIVERRATQGRPLSAEMAVLLAEARENVRLVRIGGGIHNRFFALQLLDAARSKLDRVEHAAGG